VKPIIVAITGEPCSGKSTLMRALLTSVGAPTDGGMTTYGSVPIIYTPTLKFAVIGKYDEEELFAGTDDQNICLRDLEKYPEFLEKFSGYAIFLEGVRLLDPTFLAWAKVHTDLHLFELVAKDHVIRHRLNTRGGSAKRIVGAWAAQNIGPLRMKFPFRQLQNDSMEQMAHSVGLLTGIAIKAQKEQV
jgi:hypothetical protein